MSNVFNTGDKVIGNAKANMYRIPSEGVVATVVAPYSKDRMFVQVCEGGNAYLVRVDCFDKYVVPPKDKKVVITTDGNTTLARYYEDNVVVAKAEAKCSPEDTYDFTTGAVIAFSRLIEKAPVSKLFRFNKGDTVRIKSNTCWHFYHIGDVITLTEIHSIASGVTRWRFTKDGIKCAGFITENDIELIKDR